MHVHVYTGGTRVQSLWVLLFDYCGLSFSSMCRYIYIYIHSTRLDGTVGKATSIYATFTHCTRKPVLGYTALLLQR